MLHYNQVLDAWGLGWEIWMDGMEITQFTYFQQVLFLTYVGQERISRYFDNNFLCLITNKLQTVIPCLISGLTDKNPLCPLLFLLCFQAGSLQLMPTSVEITYGLERILMLLQVTLMPYLMFYYSLSKFYCMFAICLQGVDHFKKIQYADGITYGELFSENE